jgi:hypothetical protein
LAYDVFVKPSFLFVALIASILACAEDVENGLNLDPSCQPLLAGVDCLLPYPSDFFLIDDATLPSGRRIEVTGSAKMFDIEGTSADVFDFRVADGFSSIPSLVFVLPERPSLENAPGLRSHDGRLPSVSDATLIIDAKTSSLIAHYTDVDPEFEADSRQAIMLRTRTRLKPQNRYIVVVHKLKSKLGSLIGPPEGFRRFRDKYPDQSLTVQQDRFNRDIFPVIEKLGIARSTIQLAWDFTTGSESHLNRDLFSIRDQTVAWLKSNAPQITITSTLADSDGRIETIIRGVITGPLFLEEDRAGALLNYDSSGKIAINGGTKIPFLARIPKSILTSSTPGSAFGFGHGLFGTRNEAQGGLAAKLASQGRAVVFAIDWVGMSRGDVLLITDDLVSNPYRVLRFTDRAHQSLANWFVMSHAIRKQMGELDVFRRPNRDEALFEAAHLEFIGVSMGHILAGSLAAVAPKIRRVILNVGGAGFTHIVARSRAFAPFMHLMDTPIPDPLDRQKFISTLQTQFDRIDAASYANELKARDEVRVLMQIGLGDTTVPNLASFLHARLLQLKLLRPTPIALAGLDQVEGPYPGSALALYDFGIDPSVYDPAKPNLPKNEAHDAVRGLEAALAQMKDFFAEGIVRHHCDGPCDPQ